MRNTDRNVIVTGTCDKCGRALRDHWKFCPYCGMQLATHHCNVCHAEIKSRWKYCPYCKSKVRVSYSGQEVIRDSNEWINSVLEGNR